MKAWGRLLRLSLAPTAAADIAAGVVAGHGGWTGGVGPFVLMIASLAVYHGGMAMNDWADREEDARLRPDRPIPSGSVAPAAAMTLGMAMLLAGPILAYSVSHASGAILLAVALAALAYDCALRGPWAGPLLLAFCRAGNLAAGLAYGLGEDARWQALIPAAMYGAYVLAVSRLARLEDATEAVRRRSRPSIHLGIAAFLLAAAPFAGVLRSSPPGPRMWVALGLAAAGGAGLLEMARRGPSHERIWTGAELTRATGLALRRLLVFTAAVALAAGGVDGWIVAGGILAGYPISYTLRGVFPPS